MSNIQLLPYQIKAINCKSKEICITAGIGTGKSHFGAVWILTKAIENPGCNMIMAANTYQQLMGATIKAFTNLLDSLEIPYKATLSGSKKRIELNGCYIYLYSLESYDTIRGIQADFGYIDECAYSCLEALQVIRGRLRGTKKLSRQLLLTSSPNGFNFFFDEYGVTNLPKTKTLIQAATYENIFNDDDYYTGLLETYGGLTSDLAKQELLGLFVNLTSGLVYTHFNRAINVQPIEYNPNLLTFGSVDFNIDNMSCTFAQVYNNKFYVFDEISLKDCNADTYSLGAAIKQKYPNMRLELICDSTGNQRKTSASGRTDHQILRDMGFVLLPTLNPSIRDRQNTVNIAFLKQTLFIDPKCENTIKQFETLSHTDREGQSGKADLSVTVGYFMNKLAPLRAKQQPSRTIAI